MTLFKSLTAMTLIMTSWGILAKEPNRIKYCFTSPVEDIATPVVEIAKARNYFQELNLDVEITYVKQSEQSARSKDVQKLYRQSNIKKDPKFNEIFNHAYEIHNDYLLNLLDSGECDIAPIYAERLFYLGSEDLAKIELLSTYFYGLNYDTDLLIQSSSNIKSIKELQGKTVRVGRVITYLTLKDAFKAHGVDVNNLNLKHITIEDMGPQFERGQIDAGIVYNPTNALLLARGKVKALEKNVFSTYVKSYVPSLSLVVSKKFLKSKSNKLSVKRFLSGYKNANEVALKNPDELINIIQEVSLKNSLNYYNYTAAEIEKASDSMKISQPYYFIKDIDNKKNLLNLDNGKVNEIFVKLQQRLVDEGIIREKLPLDFLKEKSL